MGEEGGETLTEGLEKLPTRNVVIIFSATFFLVYVLFTMVEPSLACTDGTGSLFTTGCSTLTITGDFILGVMISGVIFLFDMIIVYMTLSEYFM
ncbi:MAG: hypothetical protein JW789_05345 [Candidatus Aenigmarchaeota archaeon]|nr:hypothetical protein [Candidatus Aenigmarchaeota archaeon]